MDIKCVDLCEEQIETTNFGCSQENNYGKPKQRQTETVRERSELEQSLVLYFPNYAAYLRVGTCFPE